MKNKKIKFLSVFFDDLTLSEAADICIKAAVKRENHFTVVTPNIEILLRTVYDKQLRDRINCASLVLCDGAGAFVLSRILSFFNDKKYKPFREKVPGVDLGEEIVRLAEASGLSCFFLGGGENIAYTASKTLKNKNKNLIVSGYCNGYSELKNAGKLIAENDPDIVFVCLGSPLQEITVHTLSGNRLYLCLGGSLDIWANKVKRAPLFMRKQGLEWLYRFYRQPHRIGRFAAVFARACVYITIYNKYK